MRVCAIVGMAARYRTHGKGPKTGLGARGAVWTCGWRGSGVECRTWSFSAGWRVTGEGAVGRPVTPPDGRGRGWWPMGWDGWVTDGGLPRAPRMLRCWWETLTGWCWWVTMAMLPDGWGLMPPSLHTTKRLGWR